MEELTAIELNLMIRHQCLCDKDNLGVFCNYIKVLINFILKELKSVN